MGFLEIVEPNLAGWNMAGNGQNGHMVAMAIEQAVDEVKTARPAASRADSELAGHGRIGACRERACFLMADMHEGDTTVLAEFPVERVEAVARHAPDAFDTGIGQRLYNQFCYGCRHGIDLSLRIVGQTSARPIPR